MDKRVGNYSFTVGVLIAVVLGLFAANIGAQITGILVSLLVLAGLVVGFLNVAGKDTKEFLIVAVVLIIAVVMGKADATLGSVEIIGKYLSGIFSNIMAFVIPATIVVGLKDIMRLAKEP